MTPSLELHPGLVHFPIALVVVGALASIAFLIVRRPWLRWFGPILLSLALLGGGAAYFSGQSAEDRAEDIGVPENAIHGHEEMSLWALGTMGLATLLSWATHASGRGLWIAALIALAAAGVTLRTGQLGGELVYVHGAGRVGEGAKAGDAADAAPERESRGESESGDRDGD